MYKSDLSLSKIEGQSVKQQQWCECDANPTSHHIPCHAMPRTNEFFQRDYIRWKHLSPLLHYFPLYSAKTTSYTHHSDCKGVWIFPENSQILPAYTFLNQLLSLVRLAVVRCIEKKVYTDSDQLHMERRTRLMSKKHVWPSNSSVHNWISQLYNRHL